MKRFINRHLLQLPQQLRWVASVFPKSYASRRPFGSSAKPLSCVREYSSRRMAHQRRRRALLTHTIIILFGALAIQADPSFGQPAPSAKQTAPVPTTSTALPTALPSNTISNENSLKGKQCFACAYDDRPDCGKQKDYDGCFSQVTERGIHLCAWSSFTSTCEPYGKPFCDAKFAELCPNQQSEDKTRKSAENHCFLVKTGTTWDNIKEMYPKDCTKRDFFYSDHGRGRGLWQNIQYCMKAQIKTLTDYGCHTFKDMVDLHAFLNEQVTQGICSEGTITIKANQDFSWSSSSLTENYTFGHTLLIVTICDGEITIYPDRCDFGALCYKGHVDDTRWDTSPNGYCTDCSDPTAPEIVCKGCLNCTDSKEEKTCTFAEAPEKDCIDWARRGGPSRRAVLKPLNCS